MHAPAIALSVALFLLAGLLEFGGGYLVWQWLRASIAPVLSSSTL